MGDQSQTQPLSDLHHLSHSKQGQSQTNPLSLLQHLSQSEQGQTRPVSVLQHLSHSKQGQTQSLSELQHLSHSKQGQNQTQPLSELQHLSLDDAELGQIVDPSQWQRQHSRHQTPVTDTDKEEKTELSTNNIQSFLSEFGLDTPHTQY